MKGNKLILDDGREFFDSEINEIFVTAIKEVSLDRPYNNSLFLYYDVSCIVRMKDGKNIDGRYQAKTVEMPGVNYSFSKKEIIPQTW